MTRLISWWRPAKILTLMTLFALISACSMPSKQFSAAPELPFTVDSVAAAQKLAGALTYETVLNQQAQFDSEAFTGFHSYLRAQFPLAHQHLKVETINEFSLLYTWEGQNPDLRPVLLLSHQDVVPADNPQKWDHPPFSGHFDDEYIYGRGAIDVKFGIIGALEAAEKLLSSGFTPQRSLMFAFGHDEELMGTRGGEKIAQHLATQNVKLEFILDEGPAVMPDLIPGLAGQVAFVGTAARGNAYFTLTVNTHLGGHASFPERETPISILAAALDRLATHEFDARLTKPLLDMMQYVGPEVAGIQRLAYANPTVFSSILLHEYGKIDKGRAITRSTIVPTILRAGDKDATVPNMAEATMAMGFLPGTTLADAMAEVNAIIDDERVAVEFVRFVDNGREHAYDPTVPAPVDGWAFHTLQKTIHQIFPGAIVAPTLMPMGSDGKHYINAGVADNAYHFFPLELTDEEANTAHGINERLPVESFANAIRFYAQLILNVQG